MKNFNPKIFLLPFVFFSLGWGWFEKSYSVESTTGSTFTFKESDVFCKRTERDPDGMNYLEAASTYYYVVCSGSAIKKDIAGRRYVHEFTNRYCWGKIYDKDFRGRHFEYSNSVICSAAKHFGVFENAKKSPEQKEANRLEKYFKNK